MRSASGAPVTETVEVAVVGGGPVGLLLGCLLAARGVGVRVLERRARPTRHSRSIGIHPPALEALAAAGVAEALLARGVRVTRGHAYAGRRRVGTLGFDACPPPYRFVLTLPQAETERLLEARLRALDPGALRRGAEVVRVAAGGDGVGLWLAGGARIDAAVAVACDGHDSPMRQALGVPAHGRDHPDRFLMGDFPDRSDLGVDAAIYLTAAGVVEAFPLPGGLRRWVAAAPSRWAPGPAMADRDAAAARLATLVWQRVGERLDADACTMVSAFGVSTRLSRRMALGRVAFAGDAAHVVPPFGGQGMNLGWLDAAALASTLADVRAGAHLARVPARELQRALAGYERTRLGAAAAAARRAARNLSVGRAGGWRPVQVALLWAGLRTPLAGAFARIVTMRGLEGGVPGGGRLRGRAPLPPEVPA